ncbi:adenosylhomocysteinase [Microbacterium sp. SORGH_AS_0428]|uniref:adenosylhomocysteinase n=1 Tax=Microbacterium sp. SORGH_AS_0428 TaxID=3041788 RepID=UPI00286B596F|nr:adenosylhomocysteinase [Microbacterium sp. SORGH_AS_0428]
MDTTRIAEAIVRRFARRTNLMIASRTVRVDASPDHRLVAERLTALLHDLGAVLTTEPASDAGMLRFDFTALAADADPMDVPVFLGGEPLPERSDAAARIAFAASHMPVSAALAEDVDVRGLRIGVCMVLEPKTAQLALLLRSRGADVAVYGHPDETDAAVAAALAATGIPVDGGADLSGPEERAAAEGFLRRGFDILIDDGSHLIRLAHEIDPEIAASWIGANEETTSGLTPLRRMDAAGLLRTPVMAVNDAAAKTRFDNRYGTGFSCVLAIADLLDQHGLTVRDQPALVIGYGPVGEGVAAYLRALGASVAVAEVDPVRALTARHDGYVVGPASALAEGALVVSATGVAGTIDEAVAERAVAIAVAGGVPGEVSAAASAALVLGDGGAVNITAAEGNPIEIMDLSFAVQLAALDHLLRTRPGVGVHALPSEIDDRVGRAALAARGVRIDECTTRAGRDEDWRSARYEGTRG